MGRSGGSLRILLLNWMDRENPLAGGAEAHLHEVFGRLAGRGHEVTLVASAWRGAPRRVRLDGMEIHRTGSRYTFNLAAPLHCRRELAGHAFDVVVEDLNKAPFFTPLWAPAPVVLLVHHLFGGIAFQEASLPVAAATWLLERPVPRVFRDVPVLAVSESTAEDLVRRGMDRARITVVPNGIDLDFYAPDPSVPRLPEPTLLYVGRLKRYKRVDLVVRAAAALRERGMGIRLLVAGKGDHRARLEALAARLGLADAVEFLGFVSEERKRELLRRSWVHVLTSPKEGWGISNLEAAACGTPTVASDSPGLRDSVVHGRTGLLAPHGDVGALADRTAALLSDPELRERMGRQAREFAEEFPWERSARETEAALRRRVAPPDGPA